ncbi:fimbrial protein [Salmonella enterica subsp. enterica serovar Sanjuan]|uniref:Fimbrial protein n=1 Tax=Salmonella enterica subsp. enterica serovar Sanjuan TaxID=1160765 RepID=A0A447P0A0_SALET|nr:fimbrial protein [Salmonella enterica subsp. enterica serovar Sanjuan]
MKKTSLSVLLLVALSSQAMAASTNLDVTFTATLRETTCDMAIEGGTGNGQSNTIPIGTAGENIAWGYYQRQRCCQHYL